MVHLTLCYLVWGATVWGGCGSDDFEVRERASLKLESAGGLGVLVGAAGALLSPDPEVRSRLSRGAGGLSGWGAHWLRAILLLAQRPHSRYGLSDWCDEAHESPEIYIKAYALSDLCGCPPFYGPVRDANIGTRWLNWYLDDCREGLWGRRYD